MATLTIEVPEGALSALRKSPSEVEKDVRLAAAIDWFRRGLVSQGKAAEIAGIPRAAPLEQRIDERRRGLAGDDQQDHQPQDEHQGDDPVDLVLPGELEDLAHEGAEVADFAHDFSLPSTFSSLAGIPAASPPSPRSWAAPACR